MSELRKCKYGVQLPCSVSERKINEFYNRWATWIPLEGREAFLDQLRKLVEASHD